MHTLIPRFIHEQYVAGRENGRFPAVTLLLDIAGFTAMTQKLVPYGKEGAEVMADMVNRLFAPIITILHQHGGFVTLFAGDALTVVFPRHDAATALAACRAALAIGRIFARQRLQTTRLGDFALMVKQGLSAGDVAWGIVGPAAHKTYFFRGAAIAGCAHAEHRAQGGDIVVDARLQALLPPAAVLQPLDAQYARLLGLAETAVAMENPGQLPPLDPDVAGRFFAPALWQMPQLGEFRYVVTLFIAFQGANDFAGLNQFITQVMHLADRFDGFFVELDFGDKGDFFIVYFGAPVAHENDVRRGLNFVLALRAALADTPIAWRAGVTSGVVYAGYVGSPLRDKYACVGSVVNLAARLMMHAAWGEVLVAGDVARHPGFDFTPLGDVAYKGFAQGVPTYRLQGKTAAERNFSHELVGREAEMRRLLTFTQPLFVGQQAGVAVVYGEAGIGKSHFTYAFSQVLGTRVRWLTGQCDSILREPFNPFVYFLRRYFGQAAGAAAAENEASFQRRFDALLVALASIPGARRQYDELRRTRPFLGALLGLHWPDSLYERLDAQGRYQNTVTALSMLLQAECRRQPVVLELEDGHWLDDASRAFLPLLARQAADLPLLILVTSRYSDSGARPDYRLPPEVPRLEIALPALAPAALRDLAQNVLDMPIDAHLHRLLLEKTDANPLFVQQIVYYLKENRLLTVTAGAGQQMAALAGRDFDLPRTLNTLLVARLDRLTPEVKEVVQTAAVLGREFESRLLAHMLQRDLSAELQQAEHEQIWTMLNAVKYMFRHVLLRDAAYEMQLRTRLRDLHYRAAVAGEALYAEVLPVYFGALAYHYETAYRFGRAEAHASAFDFLCRAGQQALATFEHQVAADYFSRALALTPVHDDDARFRLLLAREAAYNMQGSREAQVQDLAQLAGLSRRLGVAQQAAVALRRAGHAEVTGDYDAAALLAETAVQLGQQSGDLAVVASGHQTLGIASWRRGRLADAEAHFQRAVELAQLSGNHRHVAKCLHGLGNVAFYQWDLAAAKAYYLRALAIRRDIGDRVGEGDSLNNHGLVQWHRGDYAAAKADLVQVQAIYREVGDRHGEGMSLSNLGHVIVNQGDYAAARDYFEQSLAIRREVGDRYGEAISLNELGAVALAQGQLLLAETCYLQALTIRQELNQPHHLVEDWAGLARLQLALGDRESAGRYARQVLAYLETNPGLNGAIEPMRAFHFTWHALAALGEDQAAATVLRAAVRILQAYLDKNPEPALQALYLRQPHHWALWTAWQEGSAR